MTPPGQKNAAKTHCPRGHPYDETNTIRYRRRDGGWGRICAVCKRARWKRNAERHRAEKLTTPGFYKRHAKRVMAWRLRNPEKDKAHRAVSLALRKGTLRRPDACSRCEKSCVPEASHDDYSQPLTVEWLCRQCHAAKDRRLMPERSTDKEGQA